MSNIKRWAKTYYNLSPIFQDDLFKRSGSQALVAINPRLFAAYCIKMNKENIYTKDKIESLIQMYFNKGNYWLDYTKKLMEVIDKPYPKPVNEQQSQNKDGQTRQTFHHLIVKLFHSKITEYQFQELRSSFESLLLKGQVTELDYYVIDLSLNSIDQIVEISSINLEAALEAVGYNSLQLIEKELKREINPNSFQIISLFNRIKDSINFSPELTNLYQMLEDSKKIPELFQKSHKESNICMRKQSFGYMLWLLHVNELGEFVYKFVRQNYLFSRYCENSVQITCNILQVIETTDNLRLSEQILLNELVFKMQDIQQQRQFFEHVKRNVQIEIKLKTLKEKLQQKLGSVGSVDNDQWISELDKFQIDFKSSLSVNIIKKLVNKLYDQQHFGIILTKQNYPKLLSLCIKMNEPELYRKLKVRISKITTEEHRKNGLLLALEKLYLNQPLNQKVSLNIYSIYELKRIKSLLTRLNRGNQLFKNDIAREESQVLAKFCLKISKSYKQLYEHEIDHSFESTFAQFKL